MFENLIRLKFENTEETTDMSKNELKLTEVPETVSEENLPEIIDGQVNNIKVLDKQIQKALKSAGNAREAAEAAANMSAGFWHRKDAIEGLQSAVEEIGNATADNASSQKMLFDCLQKMAQVEKIILQIGCMSIAMNRSTVRELELKLKGASKEKLSELAKKELESVVKQIRQQQDILEKQDRLETNVNTLHKESQNQKKRLDDKDLIDVEQTKRLEELGALLSNKDLVDQKQEEAILKNSEAVKVLFEYTKQKDELDKKQSEQIEQLINKNKINIINILSLGLSIISIGLCIYTIFIR